MMQQELLLPIWEDMNFTNSFLDHKSCYDQEIDLCLMDDHDFSCSLTSSVVSSNSYVPSMIIDEIFDLGDSEMVGLETALARGDVDDICDWINGDDIEANSSESSVMEVDDHLTLIHLLRAYGEAVENGERELAEVIMHSVSDKSSPLANTTARVAYNLFQSRERQGEYLREESGKSLASAFTALYQSIPNGRFAHLTANSAILDSIPDDAGVIRVVEFDLGEGVQWPSLIEALSRKGRAVRLTSIKLGEDNVSCWSFDETKKRLLSYAKHYGLSLQIEEKSVEDVCVEVMGMGMKKKNREWLVFNCMVRLPHMGRRLGRASVDEFLKQAKAMQASFGGIVVLGEGEVREDLSSCCGYASYFDGFLRYYQAVFESLEMNFPAYLAEARAAMESLFLAPLMCPDAWFHDWEEAVGSLDFETETRPPVGRKHSLGSLLEAKEMVVEGENSYSVKIEGGRENEMVLRWKETALVRVSTWM